MDTRSCKTSKSSGVHTDMDSSSSGLRPWATASHPLYRQFSCKLSPQVQEIKCPNPTLKYKSRRGLTLFCAQQQQRLYIHTLTCTRSAVSLSTKKRKPSKSTTAYLTKRGLQRLQVYLAAEVH